MTRIIITASFVATLFIAFSLPAFAGDTRPASCDTYAQSGPVFHVIAPPDAQRVTAYFPFGMIRKMQLDEIRGRWSTRVLASRQVPEGTYIVRVLIEDAKGGVEFQSVKYLVDHTQPEFDIHAPQATYGGELLPVEVDAFEPAQRVYAYVVGNPKKHFHFSLDPNTGTYKAMIEMPEQFRKEKIAVRVVVLDRAGNYLLRSMDVHDLDLLEEYGMWSE